MIINNLFKIIILLFLLSSCYSSSFRTYSNGQLIKEEKVTSPYWKSTNDSVLILGQNETVSDDCQFIERLEIKYPDKTNDNFLNSGPIYSQTFTLIEKAKDEAKKSHANLIKVVEAGEINEFPYDQFHLIALFYKLNDQSFNFLKAEQDSVSIINSNFQVVHIKNFMTGNVKIPIYFNDSLIGYSEHFRDENNPKNFQILEFKIHNVGWLTANYFGKSNSLYLQSDKDIYIHIKRTKWRCYLRFVSKYDFLYTSINS